MSGQIVSVIALLMCLVLVVGNLRAYRLNWSSGVKMALAWAAIFALAAAIAGAIAG